MRILNEQDEEITVEDVDKSVGYLETEQIFVGHQEAVPEKPQQVHYEVETFYFEDGTSMSVEGVDDPHIDVIDEIQGVFGFIPQTPEEEELSVLGIDVKCVVDFAGEDAIEEHDEYETINRYKLYTEEELKAIQEQKEEAEKRTNFIETGPNRLDDAEVSIEDLTVTISDMFIASMGL